MKFEKILKTLLALSMVMMASCRSNGGDNAVQPPATPGAFPLPISDSQTPPGEVSPGKIKLPNGRYITPAGNQLTGLCNFPSNMAASPDGNYLLVICNGYSSQQKLLSIKIPDLTIAGQQSVSKPESYYYGLEVLPAPPPFSPTYQYLVLASGGRDKRDVPAKVYLYGMDASGNLYVPAGGLPTTIPLDNNMLVGALELDPVHGVLYVAYPLENEILAVDTATLSVLTRFSVIKFPYDMKITPDGNRLYVTNWSTLRLTDPSKVSVFDVSDAVNGNVTHIRDITVGKNPQGMAVSSDGKWVYVACSEEDTVDIIDTTTNFVSRSISLRDNGQDPYGIKPVFVSLSADESKLLVANSGLNSMDIVDLNTFARIARVPAAWWPTAALEVGGYWYILNGKGVGSGPNPSGSIKDLIIGSINQVPVTSDPPQFQTYTDQVYKNNSAQSDYYNYDSSVGYLMLSSLPIKHVVYILKENKTYDQELGDYTGTNADPTHCVYCCDYSIDNYCYTPNTHKLAQEFTNLDNFYSDAEVSVDGHIWNASCNITDFNYRTWMLDYRDGSWPQLDYAPGFQPASFTKAGYIQEVLSELRVPFHNYGEIVGSFDVVNGRNWDGVVLDSRWPLTFDMTIPDVDKVDAFIDDLNAGDFRTFTYMLLPNDHTSGCSIGNWHPDSLVADNDAALGKVVDAISHSPYWPNTIIFVTQDDPQSGNDHVDAHRTIGLVISPWVKRGQTISTVYSWPNFYRTFETILGLPQMSIFDNAATPMFDIFTTTPDYTPYDAEPMDVPMVKVEDQTPNMHQCSLPLIARSLTMDFSIPDQEPYLGEILWNLHYPDRPFPSHILDQDYQADDDDGDEAEEYRELIEQYNNMYK